MEKNARKVYAILLAAGESKRLPPNKLFLSWEKHTVLEQAVDNLLNSRVTETVVVLGFQAEKAEALLKGRSGRLVFNPDYSQGMGSSVITGIKYLEGEGGLAKDAGLMLALGDEPFIGPEIIDKVVKAYQNSSRGIVVPVHQGRRGHPTIFHRKYAPEIIEAAPETGARQILRDHPADILEVEVPSEAILLDLDTPEDYEILSGRLSS